MHFLNLRSDNIMDFNDETDFVVGCLLGAYIQSLQQHRGNQHLQSGVTSLQQQGSRRRRRE